MYVNILSVFVAKIECQTRPVHFDHLATSHPIKNWFERSIMRLNATEKEKTFTIRCCTLSLNIQKKFH